MLMQLWEQTPLVADSKQAESPIESLKQAVHAGEVALSEALVTIVQLMVNMTSANAISNLVHRVCSEPPPRLEDGELDAFVAECLRLDAPLQRNPRRARVDLEVDGVSVPKGSQLLLFLGAANMDPKVFAEPAAFRPGRPEQSEAVSFGAGVHYCLGAHLVKTEMRAVLRYLLTSFSALRVHKYERVKNVDVGNYGFELLQVAVQARA